MTQDIRLSARTRPDEIRIWQHGELPLPEWMPPHMIGDIEFNGTFEVSTDHGPRSRSSRKYSDRATWHCLGLSHR
jgi:hypothetical protein